MVLTHRLFDINKHGLTCYFEAVNLLFISLLAFWRFLSAAVNQVHSLAQQDFNC